MKLLLLLAACILTSQAFILNINRRQAMQSVPLGMDQDLAENIRCVSRFADTCPQFRESRGRRGRRGSGLIVDNHLILSCSASTLEAIRMCAARARVGCESHSSWVDAAIGLWEDMCQHEQEIVQNPACWNNPELLVKWYSCFADFKSPLRFCLSSGKLSKVGCPQFTSTVFYPNCRPDVRDGAKCKRCRLWTQLREVS